jgi:uncharacterized alpha-E superfamily protein
MLGKTAGGLYWMYRYLERSENVARLIEAGFRITLARPEAAQDEWAAILAAAGSRYAYTQSHDEIEASNVIDFLLRDPNNPSSVMGAVATARSNARLVRTALTREVWEAVNESWINLKDALSRPVSNRDLPEVLGLIRQQSGLVRGALHGTQLRNDGYRFAQLGIALERADNTARIIDMKYYALLRSGGSVAQSSANVQWEIILRTTSALRSYRWLNGAEMSPETICEFLMLDRRMPRSILFCIENAADNLAYLEEDYDQHRPSLVLARQLRDELRSATIDEIYDAGLNIYTTEIMKKTGALSMQIERDYRFIE